MALLKLTKLYPCLSYFPRFFGHFESSAFYFSKNGGTNLTQNQSNRMFVVNFLEELKLLSQLKKAHFLEKCEDKLDIRWMLKTFQ